MLSWPEVWQLRKKVLSGKRTGKIAEVVTGFLPTAPRDFWEALQYYWFVHVGVTTEYNTWDSF